MARDWRVKYYLFDDIFHQFSAASGQEATHGRTLSRCPLSLPSTPLDVNKLSILILHSHPRKIQGLGGISIYNWNLTLDPPIFYLSIWVVISGVSLANHQYVCHHLRFPPAVTEIPPDM